MTHVDLSIRQLLSLSLPRHINLFIETRAVIADPDLIEDYTKCTVSLKAKWRHAFAMKNQDVGTG
jgi:hypothetical protein